MSNPKKPGSDLAALKARLAKKTKKAEPAPESPAAQIPAPGQVAPPAPMPDVPPPGHVAPPPMDVPAPGQVSQPQQPPPPQEIPAPGQVAPPPQPVAQAAPMPQAAPAAPMRQAAPADPDDPFGGGAAAAFDPSDGLIDGGSEVAGRTSKGLIIFVAFVFLGIGGVVGWLVNNITSKNTRNADAAEKGAKMLTEVNAVAETRKTIALGMEDLKKSIVKDPKKGGELVTAVLTENFDTHPQVDELFGWQLYAINGTAIRKTFDLYGEANRLKLELGYLATFLNEYGAALQTAGGPQVYAVMFSASGGKLVEAVKPMCGETMETLAPCGKDDSAKAIAYSVRTALGGAETTVPRGGGEGQAQLLLPDGQIYNFAVGLEPNRNAIKVYASLMKGIEARLEAMNKAERFSLRSLEKYASEPNVDGPQAEIADEEGS